MSNIRVTYSGLISFVISISSVFTGLIFTVIVTRRLTPEEFGSWALIGGLITYVMIIEPIVSYWSTREIARGEESGKTAIIIGGIFSSFALLAYILIAYMVGLQTNAEVFPLLFATILVPVMFLVKILNAVNLAWKPHAISYGFLGFEITKIPIALLLIYFLDLGLIGAIMTSFIAYIVNIIILIKYGYEKLKGKFNISFFRKWLKLSWLPLYPGIANIVLYLDVTIYSVITGSVVGLAYYGVSNAISNVIGQAGNISKALYPKLLEEGKTKHIQNNFSLLLYFVFPITAISLTFAKPGLFVLNPLYMIALPVVIIFTGKVFLDTIAGPLASILMGLEKVDLGKKSTFKDYIKSKLFIVPTLRLIQFVSYIVILAIVLWSFQSNSELELIIYLAIISICAQFFYTSYLFIIIRKSIKFQIEWVRVFKYFLTSVCVFGLVYLVMEEFLMYEESIIVFLPNLLPYVILGVCGYLGLTYLIDLNTRKLFQAIIIEFKK